MLKDELGIELEKESEKELGKMCDYLREIMEQGKEYWIEQGKEEGAFENMITVVKTLLENNQSFDDVCSSLKVDKKTKEKLISTGLFS